VANKVMTVLEAHVPAERWAELEQGFAQMEAGMPPQLSQAFLTQSSVDSTLWRLVAVWHSREALDEYRASGVTPGGVVLLRSVGADPTMVIFDIKGQQPA
jgi:hypothetical protein